MGINTGYSYFQESRKGNVIALIEETRLFDNRLTINGEFARSNYDGDLDDETGMIDDKAWKLGGSYTHGIFSLGARYRFIGKHFNPIGYQYFTNDRKSYEANIGINMGRVNVNGMFVSASDNVDDDPSEYTTESINGNLNVTWNVTQKMVLSFGYQRDEQNTSAAQEQMNFLQDSQNNSFSGSMNLSIGTSGSINFSLIAAGISSRNNPQNDTRNLTVNLGGSLRAGQILTLMPSIGFTEMTRSYTDETMKIFNAFITGELNLFPQVMTVSLAGSYSQSESEYMGKMKNINFSGNINFFLQKWVNAGNIILTLRGMLTQSESSGFSNSFGSLILQTDFSF